MRPVSSIAAIALLASACAPRAAPVPYATPEAIAAVDRACADIGEVDLARLRSMPLDWAPFDRFHSLVRQGVPGPPAVPGRRFVKLAIPGGGIAAPYGISVFAAEQADGRWLVSHVRYLQLPPPPQPPGTPQPPAPQQRIVTNGVLAPAAADRMEAALGSECLRHEPPLSPADLPLATGEVLACPPDAGQPNALEILQNDAHQRYLRECGRPWASGIVIATLENAQNLVPA